MFLIFSVIYVEQRILITAIFASKDFTKKIYFKLIFRHFRNPRLTGCSQCKKTCLLWHPEDYVDSIALNELRKEAEGEGIELVGIF